MRAVLAATLACFVSTLAYCAEPIEGETPRTEAIKANFDKLVSEDKAVKREALLYFGKVDKTFAAEVPLFTASLKDERNQVRAISAFALGKIGKAAAGSIPEVEKLLTDSSATVQKYAKRALERLKPFKPVPEEVNPEEAPLPQKPTPEKTAAAQGAARKWTSRDGKNSAVAKLMEVDQDGFAILQRADGRTLRLPFSELSQADLEYLKSTNEYKIYLKYKSENKDGSSTAKPTPDEVIAALEELGGRVKVDKNKVAVEVNFPIFSNLTEAGMAHLQGLTELRGLYLSATNFTDTGLKYLKGMTKLENLHLISTKVTDAGLVNLKGLTRLKYLYLSGTEVTDAGLVHLTGLTRLKQLFLFDSKVTNAGRTKIRKALPRCAIQ